MMSILEPFRRRRAGILRIGILKTLIDFRDENEVKQKILLKLAGLELVPGLVGNRDLDRFL